MSSTRKPLRCGIVGSGYMGDVRRAVIERSARLELTAICEVDEQTREGIVGCPTTADFAELLKLDVDVVFVCVPNRYAPEICIASMNARKHVFCEKPPGRTVADIEAMRAAANDDVKLMFGFNHRFHPAILKAKVMVDSGRLGKILNVHGVYGKSGGTGFRESWRNDPSVSGGGILLDQGIHMLDLFRHFCADFEHVKCFTNDSFWNFEVEDNAFVVLSNSAGQNAMLHSSATLWKHTFKMEIFLEDGYMIVEGLLSKSGSYGREKLTIARRQFEDTVESVGNPAEEIVYFDRDESWDHEVAEFVRCVDEDVPVTMSSSHDALRVMQIVEMAYEDASRNRGTPCDANDDRF